MMCGHEYEEPWEGDVERSCPKCRSNSIRHLKPKDEGKDKDKKKDKE
jgi:predicted  nucleic acid-binding Zn-ribbon protein